MVSFAVRQAVPDDLDVIRDLFSRSSLSNANDRDVLLDNPDALIWQVDGITSGRTRVATADGSRIVGFATTRPVDVGAELEDLFVDPAWMRRGVATLLVQDAISIARRAGASWIDVTANPHAAAFYAGAGFVWIADTQTQYGPAPRRRLTITPGA